MLYSTYIFYTGLLLIVLIFAAWFYTLTRRRKTQLKLIIPEFGTNIIVDAGLSNFDIQFERDGTVFHGSSVTTRNSTTLKLNFSLPQFNEKFLIRQNSSLASFHAWMDEGQFSSAVLIPDLAENYLVFSPNHDFTKTFLSNKAVSAEINSLGSTFTYPQLWLEGSHFHIELFSGSGWDIAEKITHVCRAAVVFHDNLKKLS